MPHESDIFETTPLNIGNDSGDAVLVSNSVSYCLWPVSREGRSMRHMPFLGEMAQSGELATLPAFAPENLATTARFFLDLIVIPMLLRGLYEHKVEAVLSEVEAHVASAVPFFLAACRQSRSA